MVGAGRDLQTNYDKAKKRSDYVKGKVKITSSLVKKSTEWRIDLPGWDWERGRFYFRMSDDYSWMIYSGVKFKRAEIEKIATSFKTASIEKNPSPGGRKPKTETRDDIWATILELFSNNGIQYLEKAKVSKRNIIEILVERGVLTEQKIVVKNRRRGKPNSGGMNEEAEKQKVDYVPLSAESVRLIIQRARKALGFIKEK